MTVNLPIKNWRQRLTQTLLIIATSLSVACGDDKNDDPKAELDAQIHTQIQVQALTGDPSKGRILPAIDEPLAQLGMHLFYSKALSGDMDTACVTCHHPILGGGDALALSIGVEAEQQDILGIGRFHSTLGNHYDGGPTVPRNAPTTFNIALWDKVLFHDGRVESLGKTANAGGNDDLGIRTPDVPFATADADAGRSLSIAQARFPVTSAEEMKGFTFMHGTNNAEVRHYLHERLAGIGAPPGGHLSKNEWLAEFRKAFAEPEASSEELITFDNITAAIASYEDSQVFVDTPWRAYVEGDNNAISDAAKRGALVFFSPTESGGADCASCHSGDFFTDEDFYNIGMLQIGRGKGNGETGSEDFGRYRETGDMLDKYAFRTPTLLNVSVTGPWGHTGAYASLRDVVVQHLDPQQALEEFDWTSLDANIQTTYALDNTQRALDHLAALREQGLSELPQVSLSEQQIDEVVEFLLTLTDPCTTQRECLAPWIPDHSMANPDDLRLDGVDQLGNYL